MVEELDLRGLKCPEPAIRTGKALRDHDELVVIVDDETAPQNISRGVLSRGYKLDVEQRGKDYYLHITKGPVTLEGEVGFPACATGPTVVFFPADSIGRGDGKLGRLLAKSIIYSFLELEEKPATFIFMNSGVRLTMEGAETLEDLKKLVEQGVEILVCGTCLDYFGLKEKLAVGSVSNAYTITETLMWAGKVIRF